MPSTPLCPMPIPTTRASANPENPEKRVLVTLVRHPGPAPIPQSAKVSTQLAWRPGIEYTVPDGRLSVTTWDPHASRARRPTPVAVRSHGQGAPPFGISPGLGPFGPARLEALVRQHPGRLAVLCQPTRHPPGADPTPARRGATGLCRQLRRLGPAGSRLVHSGLWRPHLQVRPSSTDPSVRHRVRIGHSLAGRRGQWGSVGPDGDPPPRRRSSTQHTGPGPKRLGQTPRSASAHDENCGELGPG